MNHPEEAPKLPTFPFIAGDLILIATAGVVAWRGATPLGPDALLVITICVVFGAALAVVPFMANYARRQNAELSERQNQIAALARTTAESADQLGIAASGLHGIAESTKHNLDTIEKLPDQLQGRLDDLTQQLAGAAIASQAAIKEDLEHLEAAAEKIATALAKLDADIKAKTDTLASFDKALDQAFARATTQIDSFVTTAITNAVRSAEPVAPAPVAPKSTTPKARSKASSAGAPQTASDAPAADITTAEIPNNHHPVSSHVTALEPATPSVSETKLDEPAPAAVSASTPAPSVTPVDDETSALADTEVFAPAEPHDDEVPVDEPPAPKPPRARKSKAVEDAAFDLGLTPDATGTTDTAVTSDGFTRLIATAYIGIGNKLFIRGEGPGLSWDKGVPLQFVSIGKWRWETPDATGPVTAKLYKNDQVECPGLGELTLEPGHQHEVNAGF
jgi:uncharacterized protein YukE